MPPSGAVRPVPPPAPPAKRESSCLSPVGREEFLSLLKMINEEYGLIGSWYGNGCEHGFKPAKNCPNENCSLGQMHRLWEKVFKG